MKPHDQLPATIQPGALMTSVDGHLVPALIADAGESAAWRYIEFFTANIRNPNTRRAYARACQQFFAWGEDRGLTLPTIRPFDVATYIEARQQSHSAPDVKQQLAAVRMLFDWLVTGQIVPSNPASSVRGPKHVVKTGKTPVLDAPDWRKLLELDTDRLRARFTGPRFDRHPYVFLCAHRRGAEHEGGGPSSARRGLAAAVA